MVTGPLTAAVVALAKPAAAEPSVAVAAATITVAAQPAAAVALAASGLHLHDQGLPADGSPRVQH